MLPNHEQNVKTSIKLARLTMHYLQQPHVTMDDLCEVVMNFNTSIAATVAKGQPGNENMGAAELLKTEAYVTIVTDIAKHLLTHLANDKPDEYLEVPLEEPH